jgi:hypothetical protein
MPASKASDLTLTWSTEANVVISGSGESVSAFVTRAWAVRGEFEGRLVAAIFPPNSAAENLPNDPATRTLVAQRLYERMDYVAPGESVALDWRAGVPAAAR